MRHRDYFCIGLLVPVMAVLILTAGTEARDYTNEMRDKGQRGIERVFVLDGSGVHNAGQLQVHVCNWGCFGSFPGSTFPTSEFPSAQWPATSGVEYLYISGLWVGARINGIPAVSTSAYEIEFRPTDDPVDKIYHTIEGSMGGNRFPSPGADDDNDGLVDEDWLDGHDNDGDGLIDEDFAAISRQMFSCWFSDDQPSAVQIYPDHRPLNVLVRQESYQWEDERFDDFVGIKYTITNIGTDVLEDLYLGFFVDGDAGSRDVPQYYQDDAAGRWSGIVCTELGPVYIDMGYAYDQDGDNGQTPGYLGIMVLGHITDALGEVAPINVGMTSFQVFSGDRPYENGGDPKNDFQRYELMASHRIDRNASTPRDYRMLISTGSFAELAPGNSLVFYVGLVAGEGLDGLIDNAANAQRLFDGIWYDIDGDPMTGIDRRETPVHGPAQGVVIDACRPELSDPVDIPDRRTVWINNDCSREADFKEYCGYDEADSLLFRTGVAGRETQIHWLFETTPVLLNLLDIRPRACPNPFNVRLFKFRGRRGPGRGGVLPVAILGSEDFDVHLVDISSVRLEGVLPLHGRRRYADVSRPVTDRTGCECTSEGPDGHLDLTLKFRSREIAWALSSGDAPVPGEERILVLTGRLIDGTEFLAADCVKFVGRRRRPVHIGGKTVLGPASPNPFNPSTRIAFSLGEATDVSLGIYDVAGRLVRVLIDERRDAGRHEAVWNGNDNSGRQVASGIYFYRLKAGEFIKTRKMALLR